MGSEQNRPYRVPEAAALAGVGVNAMYQAVKDGTVKSLRLGRTVLIPRRWFDAWLEGGTEAA